MKKHQFAFQIFLLLLAAGGLGLAVVSLIAFGDFMASKSSSSLLTFPPEGFLGSVGAAVALLADGFLGSVGAAVALLMVVFGLIVFASFFRLWGWNQRRYQAAAQEAGGKIARGNIRIQISTAFVIICVLLTASMVREDQARKAERVAQQAEDERNYRESHPEGSFTRYYSSGQKLAEGRYDHNGLIQGPITVWYDNGQKCYEGSVRDAKDYYARELRDYEWLSSSAYEGRFAKWYPDGVMKSEEFYSGGKLNGRVASWDWKGKLISEEFYIDGRANGRFAKWDWKSGNLISERFYVDGKPHGLFMEWWPNGQKKLEATFNNGEEVSKITFDRDGNALPED